MNRPGIDPAVFMWMTDLLIKSANGDRRMLEAGLRMQAAAATQALERAAEGGGDR